MVCDNSIPGENCDSGFANQAFEGLVNWNYLAPSAAPATYVMGLKQSGEENRSWETCYSPNSSVEGAVTIFQGGLPGNTYVVTGVCFNGDDYIWASSIKFKTSVNWSTDDTPGPNQSDTQSFATHEMGHVSGVFLYHVAGITDPLKGCHKGHWDSADTSIYVNCTPVDTSLCPGGGASHTMCEGIPPGTTSRRSLESHDEHTHTVIYGT
jgi:hypothetical protein